MRKTLLYVASLLLLLIGSSTEVDARVIKEYQLDTEITSVEDLQGQTQGVALVQGSKALYMTGENNRLDGAGSTDQAFTSKAFRFKFTPVTDADDATANGTFRLTPADAQGNDISFIWNGGLNLYAIGWCLAQDNDGANFKYGLAANYDGLWTLAYVEGQGFTVQNVGTQKYLSTEGSKQLDEVTYLKAYTLKITEKVIADNDPLVLADIDLKDATLDAATGYVQYGAANPGWYFSAPQDWSGYKYLVVPATRNCNGISTQVVLTDANGNTFGGEDYGKGKDGTEYANKPQGGNMWLDTWNNQRLVVVDLSWVANKDKAGDGTDHGSLDITNITSLYLQKAGGEGIYLGTPYLTNVAPKFPAAFWAEGYDFKIDRGDAAEGDWGTVCLPYGAVCNGADIFEVVSADESGVTVARVSGIMEPGKAYLYQLNGAGETDHAYFYRAGADDLAEPVVNNGLVGSFEGIDAIPEGMYVLAENHFIPVNSVIKGAANQAYFDLTAVVPTTEEPLATKKIDISQDTPTAIGKVLPEVTRNQNKIYDLQGRQLRSLQRGINVVGGRKILVK